MLVKNRYTPDAIAIIRFVQHYIVYVASDSQIRITNLKTGIITCPYDIFLSDNLYYEDFSYIYKNGQCIAPSGTANIDPEHMHSIIDIDEVGLTAAQIRAYNYTRTMSIPFNRRYRQYYVFDEAFIVWIFSHFNRHIFPVVRYMIIPLIFGR